jgi:hypothetical protein
MRKLVTTLIAVLVAALLPALAAQQPEQPKPEAEKPVTLSTRTDLAAYIKKSYPELDPTGEHDFQRIKDPKDREQRFKYTWAMARLIIVYVRQAGMGSTLAKVFDQHKRTELAHQATFKVLYAVMTLSYPEGRADWMEAQRWLSEALKIDANYEYAHYMLGVIETEKYRARPESSNPAAAEALRFVNEALKLRPKFAEAVLQKARLLSLRKPPDRDGAVKLLNEYLDLPASDVETFESALGLYGQSTTVGELITRCEKLLEGGKLSPLHRARTRKLAGSALAQAADFAKAVDWFELAIKEIKPEDQPATYLELTGLLGATWATLAMNQKVGQATLTGEEKVIFEKRVLAAQKYLQLAAEFERERMPLDLRGASAKAYALFLADKLQEMRPAAEWLRTYLDRTDLSSVWRDDLSRLLGEILAASTDGDAERNRVDLIGKMASEKQTDNLVARLSGERDLALQGKHFTSPEARELFKGLLDYPNRQAAGLAAFLLADTALQMKDEDREAAGAAICARYEKEEECVTEEQANLQSLLVQSIKLLNRPAFTLRALKQLRKHLASVTVDEVPEPLQKIRAYWDRNWLETLGEGAPRMPASTSRLRKVAGLKAFLDDCIKFFEGKVK